MITVVFTASILADRIDEFRAIATKGAGQFRQEDGCVTYGWYRQQDAPPTSLMLFEQWRDAEALAVHLKKLADEYGPPPPGQALPAAILSYCESFEVRIYEELA